MKFEIIKGDLIQLALSGKFDVIAHGCNCHCQMGAGIAVPMKNTFKCDKFDLEAFVHRKDINKLGQIEHRNYYIKNGKINPIDNINQINLVVINAYTQYNYGKHHKDGVSSPVDYTAIRMCMRKINHNFKGKHIGLPKIGCGLAGGDWTIVEKIIKEELNDCDVTICEL